MCDVTALSVLTLLMLAVSGVHGFGTGAPVGACDSMTPNPAASGGHGATPQTDNSVAPYTITPSKTTYSAGEQITVTVAGTTNTMFKGLMIQVRDGHNARQGTFTIPASQTGLQLLSCDGSAGTGVTHSSGADKASVQVTWTAPGSGVGNVHFRVTVVQTRPVFYVGLQSAQITYMASDDDDKNAGTTVAGSLVTVFLALIWSLAPF